MINVQNVILTKLEEANIEVLVTNPNLPKRRSDNCPLIITETANSIPSVHNSNK